MEKMMELAKWLMMHGPELIIGFNALLTAMIAIALVIPGEQPEKALQGIADFLSRFSRKKDE